MLRFFCLLVAALAMSSCAVVDVRDSVTYEHDNKRVPEEIISKIIPGRTTKKWVTEYVGKPDRVTAHENGSEIFTYRFSENKKNRVRVFVLFKYENVGQKEKHIFIHFVDNKVYRLWRDYTLPVIAEDMYDIQVIKTAEDQVDLMPSGTKSKKKVFRSQVNDVTPLPPEPATSESEVTPAKRHKKWWWPFPSGN